MEEEQAHAIMDKALEDVQAAFEDGRSDVIVIVIALTDDQDHLRYVSNGNRKDAEEIMLDLIDQFEEDQKAHKRLN